MQFKNYLPTGWRIPSNSVTKPLNTLSVLIRSHTVLQECNTVEWSFPPVFEPITDKEQFGIIFLHRYMEICLA